MTFTRPRLIHATTFAVVALIGTAGWHVDSSAQTPAGQTIPGTRSAPAFTPAQAALGQAAYRASCASCHGDNLDDGAFGPPLKGVTFIQKYGGRSVAPLYTVSATRMPTTAPGSLAPAVYAQIVAYILQQNAIIAGGEELPSDVSRLERMTIPQGGFSFMAFSPYTAPAPKVARRNPLERYTPVTDEMLASPASSEWLGWRRTWDAHGFSPLNQITKANVASLRVAWSWSLPPGSNEGAPLVHDGVLFVHGMGDRVQALDAQSGDLLWEYRRQLPQGVAATVKRGMALYRDRLYIGTSDANVIALDAKTGTLVWDTRIGDTKVREGVAGGVLAARGKIMVGTTGTGVGAKPDWMFIRPTTFSAVRRSSLSMPTPDGSPGGSTPSRSLVNREETAGTTFRSSGAVAPRYGPRAATSRR